MKFFLKIFILVSAVLSFSACGGEKSQAHLHTPATTLPAAKFSAPWQTEAAAQTAPQIDMQALLRSLDELAELERAGSWVQGMALTESSIRESAGDYAGAVAAAYKELALGYGRGLIQKDDIEKGLLNLLEMKSDETVSAAAGAVLAFFRGQWAAASSGLEKLFDQGDEPDGFGSWMILVCALEKDSDAVQNRRAAAAYKAIRARYAQFPEYWYRGARAFSGAAACEYAENCINSSAHGPFTGECRKILAAHTGLKIEDSSSIKTKREIESIISESINSGNPQLIDPLLPLISLPDNPYTVYAVGALRSLTSVPGFREYFNAKAAASSGRLAERLSYICRS